MRILLSSLISWLGQCKFSECVCSGQLTRTVLIPRMLSSLVNCLGQCTFPICCLLWSADNDSAHSSDQLTMTVHIPLISWQWQCTFLWSADNDSAHCSDQLTMTVHIPLISWLLQGCCARPNWKRRGQRRRPWGRDRGRRRRGRGLPSPRHTWSSKIRTSKRVGKHRKNFYPLLHELSLFGYEYASNAGNWSGVWWGWTVTVYVWQRENSLNSLEINIFFL